MFGSLAAGFKTAPVEGCGDSMFAVQSPTVRIRRTILQMQRMCDYDAPSSNRQFRLPCSNHSTR